jgi:hypothetical protein
MYDKKAVNRLEEKLNYESWVLSYLYDEVEPFPSGDARAEIKDDGSKHLSVTSTVRMSQGRVNKIIQRLYPVVFTASYKALDMQMEWILEEHRNQGIISRVPWRFSEKIDKFENLHRDGSLKLPSVYSQNKPLYDRVFSLFRDLNDHRNTIIHGEDFKISNEELEITDRDGTTFQFNTKQLFAFAKVAIITADSLISSTLSPHTRRELQAFLDCLVFVHGKSSFDCTPPWSPTLEKKARAEDSDPYIFKIDLNEIWEGFGGFPDADGFFLEAIGVISQNKTAKWRIPSDELPRGGEITLSLDNGNWSGWKID